jgi:hypothetical protein
MRLFTSIFVGAAILYWADAIWFHGVYFSAFISVASQIGTRL